jgi:ribosome-associated protein
MSMIDPEDDRPVSKTRRKKDSHALQALGEALVALKPSQLTRIELPERLADAVAEARRITGFEARRRQMQYIGKIIRDVDSTNIAEHIERIRNAHREDSSHHHDLERWRERLLTDDDAARELAATAPGIDLQRVRTLVRNARNEQARGQPPKSSRALFRLLRDTMAPGAEAEADAGAAGGTVGAGDDA